MEDNIAVIKTSPLFAGVSQEETSVMLNCLKARTEKFPKGAFILRAGNSTQELGMVLSGSVLIVQEDFWGNRNLVDRSLPGQVFAESFACSPGSTLSVSIVAETACEVMWFDVRRVLTLCPKACSHHSHLVMNLLSDLADKNLRFNEKVMHMGKRTTREKLLSYLSSQARHNGSSQFDIPFNRQQLADYLSVERSAMSAELGRLRDDGMLEFDRNHFILHIASNN